jgi:enoyl-[acyl-carrier-protein] reductase (NADH)
MKSVLEKVKEIDKLIHRMSKMESMMLAGRWIDAYRECCRLIAALRMAKEDLIADVESHSEAKDEE